MFDRVLDTPLRIMVWHSVSQIHILYFWRRFKRFASHKIASNNSEKEIITTNGDIHTHTDDKNHVVYWDSMRHKHATKIFRHLAELLKLSAKPVIFC